MKRVLLVALFLAAGMQVFSQAYMTTGGFRLGTDWGLTLKQRLAERVSGEVILQSSFVRDEVMLTMLAERHVRLLVRHFNVYGGAGFHTGWGNSTLPDYRNPFGISFIGGVELTLGRLNLSYDLKPALNLRGGEQIMYAQTALSVRYVLLDDKAYRDRQRDKKKRKRLRARDERRQQRQENGVNWRFWE